MTTDGEGTTGGAESASDAADSLLECVAPEADRLACAACGLELHAWDDLPAGHVGGLPSDAIPEDRVPCPVHPVARPIVVTQAWLLSDDGSDFARATVEEGTGPAAGPIQHTVYACSEACEVQIERAARLANAPALETARRARNALALVGEALAALDRAEDQPWLKEAQAVVLGAERRETFLAKERGQELDGLEVDQLVTLAAVALQAANDRAAKGAEVEPAALVNRSHLEKILDDLRFRYLTRRYERELKGGEVVRFARMTPEQLTEIADGIDTALMLFDLEFRALVVKPSDLLILRAQDPRSVPTSTLDMLASVLHRAAVREGLKDGDQTGPVMVLGADLELEQLSREELKKLGLQAIVIPREDATLLQALAKKGPTRGES